MADQSTNLTWETDERGSAGVDALVTAADENILPTEELNPEKSQLEQASIGRGFLLSGVSTAIQRLADYQIDHRIRRSEAEALIHVLEKAVVKSSAAAREAEEVDLRFSEQHKVISALKDRLTQEKSTLLKLQSV
ncbi:MAG: hypothetical protein VB878_18895 [Pirellulaceae bacterium]